MTNAPVDNFTLDLFAGVVIPLFVSISSSVLVVVVLVVQSRARRREIVAERIDRIEEQSAAKRRAVARAFIAAMQTFVTARQYVDLNVAEGRAEALHLAAVKQGEAIQLFSLDTDVAEMAIVGWFTSRYELAKRASSYEDATLISAETQRLIARWSRREVSADELVKALEQ